MNEDRRQYTDRIEYRNVVEHKVEGLNYDSPEWIINLRNYFEKETIRDDYSSHS